jgi:hypothetical protein
MALIVAGVLIVGGGAAFGVTQLLKEDEPPPQNATEQPREKERPVVPANVTVSVLNGTQVPGLAAQIADQVQQAGFQKGNVSNATEQARNESVVLYTDGARREALAVARKLEIGQIEPIDPESRALAGPASVTVIVGTDQTQ